MKGLDIEGIYTHFACSDAADKTHATGQFSLFMRILDCLSKTGMEIPIRHAANSAALLQHPETHLDMVRPGIALYGLFPSPEVHSPGISLRPAMSLKSRIVHLKEVPEAFAVSYGCTFQTDRKTRIATVPVGYADGFNRLLSNRGQMLVHGVRAQVTGRVCMDLTMIDVGHIPDAAVGDEVVVFGSQGQEAIRIEEMARALDTINYEIVTTISERIPRVYLDG
jgi:alanine racemase